MHTCTIRDFDGSPSGWEKWVHAFKSAMRSANPGVLEFMNEAEKMTTEAKDDNLDSTMAAAEVKKMSGELYNILSQYCTGEALTIVRGVTTFEGFVSWQRLHKKFSPKTMARAIRLMTEVASPKAVREFQEVEEAITSWENKVKKLESEYGEKLSDTMKTAIVTGMMLASIQDFVYTNVDETTRYQAVVDKLRSWAGNNLAMMSGPVPMDVGEVHGKQWAAETEDWEGTDVQAVGAGTQCHRCGGWGHMARECPTSPGKSKGKGKDYGGYVGFKGKGKGMAKGGGDKGFGGGGKGGDIKGKGKGYQGTCWTCGVVGHKSSECLQHRPANSVEDDVGGAVSHVEVDVGGVWMIGAVEAKEIVEAPPGLGGCGGQRRRIETSNRFEVLAREEDDWKLIPGRRARGTMVLDVGAVDDQSPKTGMSRESAMRFNVAKVQKPLASAAKGVEAGNRISMGPNPCDNYIENASTGERGSACAWRGGRTCLTSNTVEAR